MKITLNKEAEQEIAKLTFTSTLTLNQLAKKYGLSAGRLSALKKNLATERITTSDWILGSLTSQPKSTVQQIQEYIDFKNRDLISTDELRETLELLHSKGFVYEDGGDWNLSERTIELFNHSDERLAGELTLAHFNLEDMKAVFNPPTDDPLMYNGYELNSDNFQHLNGAAELQFNFEKYSYFLACRQGENAI